MDIFFVNVIIFVCAVWYSVDKRERVFERLLDPSSLLTGFAARGHSRNPPDRKSKEFIVTICLSLFLAKGQVTWSSLGRCISESSTFARYYSAHSTKGEPFARAPSTDLVVDLFWAAAKSIRRSSPAAFSSLSPLFRSRLFPLPLRFRQSPHSRADTRSHSERRVPSAPRQNEKRRRDEDFQTMRHKEIDITSQG